MRPYPIGVRGWWIPVLALGVACSGGGSDERTFTTDTAPPTTVATTTTTAPVRTMSAGEIVEALKARGLPIAEVKVYTAEDDENALLGRPGQYIGKANWHDSRLEAVEGFSIDAGGTVEVFDDLADAQRRSEYIDTVTSGASFLAEYHWLVGKAFLRLAHALTPDQAKGYETAFRAIVG